MEGTRGKQVGNDKQGTNERGVRSGRQVTNGKEVRSERQVANGKEVRSERQVTNGKESRSGRQVTNRRQGENRRPEGNRQTATRRNDGEGSRADRERIRIIRQERERKRKIRNRVRFIRNVLLLFVFACIFIKCGAWLFSLVNTGEKNVQQVNMPHTVTSTDGNMDTDITRESVAVPVSVELDDKRILKDAEIEEALAELAQTDDDLAEIYMKRIFYPEELLAALVNNPEMTEFVKGYLTADKSLTGEFNEEELSAEHPLLIQWDERWGYYPYGSSNIGIAGCGPTCLSMVILSLKGDAGATPDVLADFSMENGHYVAGAGTAWSLMTDAVWQYGISVQEMGMDEDTMKYKLDRGGMIICSMFPGDFTTTGHFIVIFGYDENGFMVNDPNSRERSGRQWSYDTLRYQIKNMWGYE